MKVMTVSLPAGRIPACTPESLAGHEAGSANSPARPPTPPPRGGGFVSRIRDFHIERSKSRITWRIVPINCRYRLNCEWLLLGQRSRFCRAAKKYWKPRLRRASWRYPCSSWTANGKSRQAAPAGAARPTPSRYGMASRPLSRMGRIGLASQLSATIGMPLMRSNSKRGACSPMGRFQVSCNGQAGRANPAPAQLTYSGLTCEDDKNNQISLRRKNHGVNGGL